MGKVVGEILKVVVIAAAFVVGGPLGAFIATAAISIGSSLLAKKPTAPQSSPENIDRLNASIDPRTPRKTVIGTTAMATDIRDQEYTDDQLYLHRFIVVASHKVHAINEIWFDDVQAWTLAGGAQGKYAGWLTVTPILEGTAGNAINISARMGSTRRFTGLAYVHLRYKIKDEKSPFAQGVGSRMTIIGDGAFVYDPRLDSTVAGGSGPCRANDQSTWVWTDDTARNPALALLFYLLGWRIAGKLAIGRGIPAARIDMPSFIAAANLCDEPVTKVDLSTEPRYRVDGVWGEGDSPSTVLDTLKASMNAELDDVGGKIRLTVIHNDLATPVTSFTASDILSAATWKQTPSIDSTFNIVRGVFTDPSTNSLYQQVDYPQVELASVDGIDRIDTFNLPMVESPSQAQRLAKMRLQRQQYGGTFEALFQITAWRVNKNDVVRLTFPALGWVNKLFRIAQIEFRDDGTVPMVLREENAAIYAWDKSEVAAVQAAAPTTYNEGLNPIIQSLGTLQDAQLTPRGDYSGATTYHFADLVVWTVASGGDGGGYVRIGTGDTTGTPPSDASKWAPYVDSGQNAVTVYLTSDRQNISYNAAGVMTPSGQAIEFNAYRQNTASAATFSIEHGHAVGTYLSGSGDTRTMSAANIDALFALNISTYSDPTIAVIVTLPGGQSDIVRITRTANGAAGASGNTIKRIYKRAASAPSTPSGNYTPSGWTSTLPSPDGNPAYASDAEISGADGVTLVGAWTTPVIFEAVTVSPSTQTIILTAQVASSAAITVTLANGEGRNIEAQIRVTGLSGSTTQKVKIETREVGGSYATLGTEGTDTDTSVVVAMANETLVNSSGATKVFEVRATTSKTGGTGTVDQSQSYLRA